jgi:hypothetical protein
MAKNQFNAWEPGLDGLEGNFQAQPRVFAHDAKAIVIGAVNSTWGDGGFSFVGGTSFVAGDVGSTMTAATGSATFTITSVAGGAITGLDIVNLGSGYTVGTSVNLTGGSGSGASFTPTNIDIPNTQKRGCCVYVGAGGNMSVIMESGSSAIQFTGLSSGTFLPILIKRVTAATATDLIALY